MKKIKLLIILAVITAVLCSCSPGQLASSPQPSTPDNADDQAIKQFSLLYSGSDPLNPYTAASLQNRQLAYLLYDPLVRLTPEFQPDYMLAGGIEQNGKSAVITLRPAYFSDGTAVTADDVVYSYKLAISSDTAYPTQLAEIKSFTAGSKSTINVTLSKDDPYFANLLDFPIIKSGSDKLTDSNNILLPPIGSGRYVPDLDAGVLTANDSHIAGAQSVKTIALINAPDSEVIKYNLEAGNVSIYGTDLSDGKIPSMVGNSTAVGLNNIVYVGVNTANELLSDPVMRYALSAALDRSNICSSAYFSYATEATGIFNPLWQDAKGLQNIEPSTNTQNVVAYLNKLGYNSKDAEGFFVNDGNKTLTLSFICYGGNERRLAAARMIAEQLKTEGFKINLKELDWDGYTAALSSGNFDLYIAETKLLGNMDITELVTPGGALAFGIKEKSAEPAADDNATGTDGGTDTGDTPQQTEPAEPAEPEVTVADAVAGFYGGQLSLVDVLSAFNTEMPIIPICYRSGVTVTKSYLKADNVSSVTDVYFGIQGIMNK